MDELKIDGSFVRGLARDPHCTAVVRTTAELGHAFALRIVAEGVEDERTWDQLAACGCDVIQGYVVAAPIAADAVAGWAREWEARTEVSVAV